MTSESLGVKAETASVGSGGDLGAVRETIRATAADVGAEAKQTASSVRDEAVSASGDLKDEISGVADAARERAMGFVDQQKLAGATHADGFAKAIDRAADELQEQWPQVAGRVREAASVVSKLAGTLRERPVGEVVGEVEGLARRQPIAFFSVAALAGLALSRFVKSSSSSTPR